jgi:hypothetical protein
MIKMFISKDSIDNTKNRLLQKHGDKEEFRVFRGVEQVSFFWRKEDGSPEDFVHFCEEQFISDEKKLQHYFQRVQEHFEILYGSMNKINLRFKKPVYLDWGDVLPIDLNFAKFEPNAHLEEDLFKNKIAFFILLNFPTYSLTEKMRLGKDWKRGEWATARLGDSFISRIPAEINQKISDSFTEGDNYISNYNIFMGKLIDKEGNTNFPEDLKLLSHWGLRDEIRGRYNDPEGLFKQQMIYEVMKLIISQEIPGKVVDNPDHHWEPFENRVLKDGNQVPFEKEGVVRYQYFLNIFKSIKLLDTYYPNHPTHLKRVFEIDREIPEKDVEELFVKILSSTQVRKLASMIEEDLGRKLQPFDIWYNGFKNRDSLPEEELDKVVQETYPNINAFEEKIEDILIKLGFKEKDAAFIASKITVEPARGSGHAWGAEMKSENAYLRTRVTEGGMNYKGFNTAMHELGHCVEQTLSLYKVDHYMLHGIPNTAFTESFAFLFQDRDFQVLGRQGKEGDKWRFKVLDTLWMCFEIMGVSLVDMKVWNWLYKNPEATPEQLKNAVITIAKDIWNTYFSDVFGVRDQTILAIYSHMIDLALYLPDYPLGHIICFQVEKFLQGKNLGEEMHRMCVLGKITPREWMLKAVGETISADSLLHEFDKLTENG